MRYKSVYDSIIGDKTVDGRTHSSIPKILASTVARVIKFMNNKNVSRYLLRLGVLWFGHTDPGAIFHQ